MSDNKLGCILHAQKKLKIENTKKNNEDRKKSVKKEAICDDSLQQKIPKKGPTFQSLTHLSYSFLQPQKIMDKNKYRPDHPKYNPKTLYIPEDFFEQQTPVSNNYMPHKILA